MIITLVTDQFFEHNHGTSVSSQRVYEGLVALGHTVRIVAIDDGSHTQYGVKTRDFGKFINSVVSSQGFEFGKPERQILVDAITGADIVHVYLPFKLEYKAVELCKELDVPCTAGFHLAPENITSTLYLNKSKVVNGALWKDFYHRTYRHIKHIHTPSIMIANQLIDHKYRAYLHIISNGYEDNVFKVKQTDKPAIFKDKFIICFVGRFSREKRHDLIIKAVNASKYRDKIQLIFAGQGPVKNRIMNMAKVLPNYPVFTFLDKPQLVSLFNFSDLYIHPADIEVEGMSCLEAIACGCVPVVSDAAKSATKQFAVHPNSIFKHGDYMDLKNKIEYWVEHPRQCAMQRQVVSNHAKQFTLKRSMQYYVDMFEAAIKDWDKDYNGNDKSKAIETKVINPYTK